MNNSKLQLFLNNINYDIRNYIFRFLSITNLPNLSISSCGYILKNIELNNKLDLNRNIIKIKDTKNRIYFIKCYFNINNELHIGKITDNGLCIPLPYNIKQHLRLKGFKRSY